MRRKIFCGLVCVVLSVTLIGCGGTSETTETPQQITSEDNMDVEDTPVDEKTEETVSEVVQDDSVGAWILRKDVTDKEVLDDVAGAVLFVDNMSLPINVQDMMNYTVKASGVGKDLLSSLVDSYTDSFNYLELDVYDNAGEISMYMPDLILGKEDSDEETTIKQAISDGNWMIGPSKVFYDTLGLTKQQYDSMCNENAGIDGEYLLADKLYEMLGSPNYVGWFLDDKNNTKYGVGYDAKEYVKNMRSPEEVSSESVTSYSTYIGWQFSDYAVVLNMSETSDSRDGVTRGNVHDLTICYIPSSYGTIEDVYGENAIADFLSAK